MIPYDDGRGGAWDPWTVEAQEEVERRSGHTYADDQIWQVLDLLPAPEADVLELTLRGIDQKTIAKMLGITQPSVCGRLRAARHRATIHLRYADVSDEQIRDAVYRRVWHHDTWEVWGYLYLRRRGQDNRSVCGYLGHSDYLGIRTRQDLPLLGPQLEAYYRELMGMWPSTWWHGTPPGEVRRVVMP